MAKTKIIEIMEVVVKITVVTVIMMTYRRNSMEKKNNKTKLDLITKLDRQIHREIFFIINVTNTKPK